MSKEHYIEKYYSIGKRNEFNIVTIKIDSVDPTMVIEEKDLVGFRFYDKEGLIETNYSSMYYFGEHLSITDLLLTGKDDFIRGLQLNYLNRLGIEEAIFCEKSGEIIYPVNKNNKTLDEIKIEEVTKNANAIFISQKDFIDRIVSFLEKYNNKVSMEVTDIPTPILDIITGDDDVDNTKVNIRTYDLYIDGYKTYSLPAIKVEEYEPCIKLGDAINSISTLYREFPYLKYMINNLLLELWNSKQITLDIPNKTKYRKTMVG